jgi:anthranilate phosphoribosyltransferase
VEELRGGSPEENARLLRAALAGKSGPAIADSIIINAAGAMAAESGDFSGAIAEARESLESGAALAKLDALIAFGERQGA